MDRKLQRPVRRGWITFIVFLLMAVSLGVFRQLGNVDEIWNYNFGSNMASGHQNARRTAVCGNLSDSVYGGWPDGSERSSAVDYTGWLFVFV